MRKIFISLAATLALCAPAIAAPGDMSVATFLTKADALKAKGAMALFSDDMSLLKQEGTAAGEHYRARLQKERAAGQPSSCPPKGAKVNSDDLLNFLRKYPAGSRSGITMKTAIAEFMIAKYPCK